MVERFMKTLLASKKKKIVRELDENFGIGKVDGLFLQFGKEKIRVYNGSLSKEELIGLDKNVRVENVGLYLAKVQSDGFRLSLDGCGLLKDEIDKNILELDDSWAERWFKGEDLAIVSDSSLKILKNGGDFIGCGKSTGEKITNSLPKERRVRVG
jgi:NOL1/NOP2/fmu family ribosome biogenesis protein|tara:strand:+ start:324 stop:788 length:465 start_codon:yes stop_codon:yes gene_type:complete